MKRVFSAVYRKNVVNYETDDVKAVYFDDFSKRKAAYGICEICNKPPTGELWCRDCNCVKLNSMFKKTSGDSSIDQFVKENILESVHSSKLIMWIEPSSLLNIVNNSAIWAEGNIDYWDNNADTFSLTPLKDIYLYDVENCYGITFIENNYKLVVSHRDKSLREYFSKGLLLSLKLQKLAMIARGLDSIHNANYILTDFTGSSVFFNDDFEPFIEIIDKVAHISAVVKNSSISDAMLPYTAPEVLNGNKPSKESNIYTLGIIINEFISRISPYQNLDISASSKSINEFKKNVITFSHRPIINSKIPDILADFIKKCWDANSNNRPTAIEITNVLMKWADQSDSDDESFNEEICSEFSKVI